jgi:hypothetical protein
MSTKISQLTSAADVTASDLIQIVDVEDGVMAPSGTNKKITASLLAKELAKQPLEPGIVISGSSSGDAVRITQTGSGNALVVEDSTNPDATPFVVAGNGHVGIGTNSPQFPLDVENAGIRINSSRQISSNADNGSLSVFGGTAGNGANIELYGSSHVGSPNMAYIDADVIHIRSADGASEKMRITSAGNVGIGTGTPTEKLDVTGNIKASQLYINNPSGDSSIEVGGAGNVYIDLKKPNSDDRDLRITTDGTDSVIDSAGGLLIATANNERMRITNIGSVGIGTATPSSKLHVNGDLTLSSTTVAASASAGSNGDVPAQVGGYLVVNVNGTSVKIPYYPA